MTKPKNPGKPKRAPRKVVTVRLAPESIPLIEETVKHMGLKDRSALIRNATAEYVKEHHPVHGTRAKRAQRR